MDIVRFCKDLCESLGANYTYQIETAFQSMYKQMFIADALILYADAPFIIVEAKKSTSNIAYRTISDIQEYLRIPWSILYQEDYDAIYLRPLYGDFENYGDIKETAQIILNNEADQVPPLCDFDYYNEISNIIRKHLKNLPQSKQVEVFVSQLKPSDIQVSESYISFNPDIETRFFESLLGKISQIVISRYTSKNTLYQILDTGTYGMCSINCMNDSSEVDYADSYINVARLSMNELIKEGNEIFITSACDVNKSDNLLMWRLYAQNAEGICMNLGINPKGLSDRNFYLYPISYGTSDSEHIELNIIRDILNWGFRGPKFIFHNWKIWKHFFKSHHFKYEEEIRLLYYNKSNDSSTTLKWIHDSYTGIASPILIFNSADFPLKLKNVVIGPRDIQSCTNSIQLNERINNTIFGRSVDTPFCRESKIKIYR